MKRIPKMIVFIGLNPLTNSLKYCDEYPSPPSELVIKVVSGVFS